MDDSRRVWAIDVLRGLVMVLMALDHARVYFGDIRVVPEDLAGTTPAIFFTRWITHICAPVFVFLAGTSAWLYGARVSRKELSFFLWTRGLWLILLEFTVIHLAWTLTFGLGVWFIQVISAIGVSMIVLSAVVFVPRPGAAVLGLAIVLFHNLLDPLAPGSLGGAGSVWRLLHEGGEIRVGGDVRLLVEYPLLPWVGVMCVGYALGPVFRRPPRERRRPLIRWGLALTALFIALRWLDVYGDPRAWTSGDSWLYTLMSFLNTTKYPPSLLFLLMTMGPALALLGLFDRRPGFVGCRLVRFGRVPLFFYAVHIYAIHIASGLLYALTEGEFLSGMQTALGGREGGFPEWYGHGLGTVYLAWGAVVVALYPLCAAYARLKAGGRWPLLRYL